MLDLLLFVSACLALCGSRIACIFLSIVTVFMVTLDFLTTI